MSNMLRLLPKGSLIILLYSYSGVHSLKIAEYQKQNRLEIDHFRPVLLFISI